jgi:hypothetical protein
MVGMNYCGDPSTLANVYALQMLTSPLTSTSYDGDAVVQGTTTIDTSAVFSLPANVKAVYVWLGAKWAAASESSYAALRPTGNANAQVAVRAMVANITNDDHGIVKCDANGDFDLTVGGADTTALHLQILGYFI